MSGKVKSLYGVYKALGRDAFLAAAKMYSDHVQKTVEATLSEMESRWYDAEKNMTEADEMINDYNFGFLTKERATELLTQEKLQNQFEKNMNDVLKNIDFIRLESSCQSLDKSYAGEVLRQMHDGFVSAYGSDYLEDGSYSFVHIPAVIRSRQSGKLCLGIVTLDLESSGEHWGTEFLTPYGIISQNDPDLDNDMKKYIREQYIPYDYWYTADVENDIHISFDNVPESVSDLIAAARGEEPNMNLGYIKM